MLIINNDKKVKFSYQDQRAASNARPYSLTNLTDFIRPTRYCKETKFKAKANKTRHYKAQTNVFNSIRR